MKIYQALANVAFVLNNPEAQPTAVDYQSQMLDKLVKLAPSGSGFDAGTEFISVRSGDNRLVFRTSFHHMNNQGSYDGWTEHDVYVTPSLLTGFTIRVTGKNRNDIKNVIADTFHHYLVMEIQSTVNGNLIIQSKHS